MGTNRMGRLFRAALKLGFCAYGSLAARRRGVGWSSAAEVVGLCFVLVGFVLAGPALAQPQAHDFGVFADWEGTESTLGVEAFQTYTIYIVGFVLDGEVKGFEFSFELPPEALLFTFTPGTPSAALTLWNPPNVIVGTGGCFDGEPSYLLGRLNFGFFDSDQVPADAVVCLGPATPSKPALDGRPGYVQCSGAFVPFGLAQSGGEFYPDGCLVINPTHPLEGPVAVEQLGLGALKARFGMQ